MSGFLRPATVGYVGDRGEERGHEAELPADSSPGGEQAPDVVFTHARHVS